MALLSQDNRLIKVDTPVGKDAFIATRLHGDEGLSEVFQYELELLSDKHDINQKDIVGKAVTVSIHHSSDDADRYIHGYVNRFSCLDVDGHGARRYAATIIPGFWFTQLSSNNRVFHLQSADDIIKSVLGEYSSVVTLKLKLTATYQKREYCVQFDETDFDFVQRLMAEEGISYHFTHSDGAHELVLTDDNKGFQKIPGDKIDYDTGGTQPTQGSIHSWQREYAFHTGNFEHKDYSEYPAKESSQQVKTKSPLNSVSAYTQRRYGEFHFEADDNKHALKDSASVAINKVAMEASEAGFDQAQGSSDVAALTAGWQFEIDHHLSSEAGKYLVTRLHIDATDGNDASTHFENRFSCIPESVTPRTNPAGFVKKVHAPQLAEVLEVKATGADSSEDPYTQVKVKFPWNSKENSCWMRVAQQFAGKNWGANFVPRVGQEVVVSYINGDADRPLVTGAVYNTTHEGPNYTETQSGWKTQHDGSALNEFRFDDKKDSEEVYFEAGKDHTWKVNNDQTGEVLNDQSLEVTNNRNVTVLEGNEEVKIDSGNQTITIGKGNQTTTVSQGNHELKVSGGSSTIKAAKAIKITSDTSIELKVGGNSVKIDQSGITIKGIKVTSKASAMGEVSAGGILTVKGSLTKIN